MDKQAIKYTWEHKKAFLKVEKELLHKNSLRAYLHDIDKLFLYLFMDKKKAHGIHRNFARHHKNNMRTTQDKIHGIIDWECARYTKPDKPLSAVDFIKKTMSGDEQIEFLILAEELGL